MARSVTIPVDLDFSDAEKKLRRFRDKTVRIKLDPKDFNQPLGRITGQLGEFDKSLAASNARVIAFGASASAIYAIQKALTSTVKAAIDVEKTLADINVILNSSSGGLKKFGDELFKIAGNTGQSFNEVAKAATELARQGLSVEQTLKRTSNALILTRLSGLDAASSVESLTAAINSFNKSALTSTEIVNKLANVDAAFAVSSKDLAEAIRRVGSTAADANVSFDELVAAVTAAQQVTARGGSVIGNSFKTIFTRLQRPRVLNQLREIGVETKNAEGATRPLIGILRDLAKQYDSLAPSVKATTSELIGGVFQINIVKAALSDLGKEFSIFDSALKTSIASTDEANKRNEALNQTLSAMVNKTFANLQKVAADAGTDMFSPMLKNLVGGLNSALEGLSEDADTKSAGAKIASGIFKGIGDFLQGPGILLGAVALFRIVGRIYTTSTDALKSIVLTSGEQEKLRQTKMATFNILQKEPDILQKVLNNTMSIEEAHNKILESINDETEALRLQMSLASDISKALVKGGVSVPESGPFAGRLTSSKKAGGYKPDWMGETIAMSQHGYSRSDMRDPGVRAERIHDGRGGSFMASVNKHEQVSTVKGPGGKKGTFVIPPKDSDAFRNLKAGGFTPNFAKAIGPRDLNFDRKGNKYNISGTIESILGMYSSKKSGQGIGSSFWNQIDKKYAGRVESDDLVRMTAMVKGFGGSKNPADLERIARRGTGASDPSLSGDKRFKGKGVMTRSGYSVRKAEFYPTDLGAGSIDGFNFRRGDAKRKVALTNQVDFYKATIGKNLRASLMEMDPRTKGFKENLEDQIDYVDLGNYLLATMPTDKLPLSAELTKGGSQFSPKVFNPKLKGSLAASKLSKGFVPNFATGIYDSDYIPGSRTGKQAILDAITGSGKPIKTVMGPAGSGKSTFTSGMGKRITSMGQVGKFDDFVIIYGGGQSRKGGLTAMGKQVFGATTGGVTAVAPSNQQIFERRIGRLNKARHKGFPDERDYSGLKGTLKAPYNQYGFMAQVKKMMQSRGQSFNVVRAGGFIPNFASESLDIKNTKGVSVKAGRVAYDWNNMSERDFRSEYGSDHFNERVSASKAGLPWSKWKQGQNRKSRQGETQFIKSPHVMLTADTDFPAGRSTVKKIVDGKNYSVQFPHGGLRKSPAGAGSFKNLINQEMSGGLSNVYDRLGFSRLETGLGAKQSPDFDKVMRQSNIDQTMGNLFDGLVKNMIRSSSKTIDDDSSNTDWDIKSTTGVIAKAFNTKEGLKGDLKLSGYGDGPLDFAEKVLREKGITRTKKRNLASGFMPNFAKGVQKAIMAEKMFGGKGASPVLDYSEELRSRGLSGLYVRDKKQAGMQGVKRDHGGISSALKDSKRMQGNMAKGYIPNFAKDDELSGMGGSSSTNALMLAFAAPMAAQILAELAPSTKNFATSVGEAAAIFGTVESLAESLPKPLQGLAKAAGRLTAAYTFANGWYVKSTSKVEEFTKASEAANQSLTGFGNGIQAYLQNFEAYNNTILDSNKSAEQVARVQIKMVEALNQIDSRYRAQIASAKSVEDAQEIQAVAMRKLAAETKQVTFATDLQKLFDKNRSLSSLLFGTEILDGGNLRKIGDDFFKSIGSDALLKANNIDSILTGSQEQIIEKLQGAFNIDSQLVESLSDFEATEFVQVIEQLRIQIKELKESEKFMKELTELRKIENERLKEFRDAAKDAQTKYTDFVNALRASGGTFLELMSGTMDSRNFGKNAERQLALTRGKGIVETTVGLSDRAKLEMNARLENAKAGSDLLKNVGKQNTTAMKEAFSLVQSSFEGRLSDSADPTKVGEISKTDVDLRKTLNEERADAQRRLSNLDPQNSTFSDDMFRVITELGTKIGDPEKQSELAQKLNKLQAESNNKLAELGRKEDAAKGQRTEQLRIEKKKLENERKIGLAGGVKGFTDPSSQTETIKQFTQGQRLSRLGTRVRGKTGANARGRGALLSTQALQAQGFITRDQAMGVADIAAGPNEERIRSMMKAQRSALIGTGRAQLRAGDKKGFAVTKNQVDLLQKNLDDPNFIKDAARKQIEDSIGVDPAEAQKRLAEELSKATEGSKSLAEVLNGLNNNLKDGSALDTGIKGQIEAVNNATTSQMKLDEVRKKLSEEENISRDKLREALDELRIQSAKTLAQESITEATTEGTNANKALNEFLSKNTGDGIFNLSMDAEEATGKLQELARHLDTSVSTLAEFNAKLKEKGIDVDEDLISMAKAGSPAIINTIVRGLTAGNKPTLPFQVGPERGTNIRASGYVPNLERAKAREGGYTAGAIKSMMIGGNKVTYNTNETVKRFSGMSEPAIMPPLNSRAGSGYRSSFMAAHGFDPYAASGFVPNFAAISMSTTGGGSTSSPTRSAGLFEKIAGSKFTKPLTSQSGLAKSIRAVLMGAISQDVLYAALAHKGIKPDELKALGKIMDEKVDINSRINKASSWIRSKGIDTKGLRPKNLIERMTRPTTGPIFDGSQSKSGSLKSRPAPIPGTEYRSRTKGKKFRSPRQVTVSRRAPIGYQPMSARGVDIASAPGSNRYTFSDRLQKDMFRPGATSAGARRVPLSQRGHSLFGPSSYSSGVGSVPRRFVEQGRIMSMVSRAANTGAGRFLGGVARTAAKAFAPLQAVDVGFQSAGAKSAYEQRVADLEFEGNLTAFNMGMAASNRMKAKDVLNPQEMAQYTNLLNQQTRAISLSGKSSDLFSRSGFLGIGQDFAGETTSRSDRDFLHEYETGGRTSLGRFKTEINRRIANRKKTFGDPSKAAMIEARDQASLKRIQEQNKLFELTGLTSGERMQADADGNLFLPSARKAFEEQQQKEAAQISAGVAEKEKLDAQRAAQEAERKRVADALARSKAMRGNLMGALSTPRADLMNPATARRESDRLRDEALRRGGFAGGYVPNFQGINDAIRREIRDGGVSRNQVRVHLNPDAVTNTRDEPRGMKDVPNYAANEDIKRMADTLSNMLSEVSALREQSSKSSEESSSTESTVRHINSPLSINVSGNIQETNSNIDEQIFNAVVKAVEKLRGGVPVSPPKAPQNETGI